MRLWADFNGLFGNLLCLSHQETCRGETGVAVHVEPGMTASAYMEDEDELGHRDDLIASGIIETAPEWLACKGSRWVLRIDANGVRHQSETPSE